MTGKEVGQYRAVFQALKRKYLRITNNRLEGPLNLIQDFENSMKIAFETEFPRSRARGNVNRIECSLGQGIYI